MIWLRKLFFADTVHKRVLRLLLASGMLTILVLCGLDFGAMHYVRHNLNYHLDEFGQSFSKHLERLATEQAKERLLAICDTRAQNVEHELTNISDDIEFLASIAEAVVKSPQNYLPQTLPDGDVERIYSGQAYLHIPQKVRNAGISAEVWQEIGIAANVAENLCLIGDKYTHFLSSCQLGSKHGYMIINEETGWGDTSLVRTSPEEIKDIDPRTRPWYETAKNSNVPVYTDPYVGTTGVYEITCSKSYNDANGFAGVVGITTCLTSLSKIVKDTSVGSGGFSFILNRHGEVILSAQHEGMLSVKEQSFDLRKLSESLGEAARQMASGEKGVTRVTVDGEEYFLAFSPMGRLQCSFGSLMKKDEVTQPAVVARHAIMQQIRGLNTYVENFFENLKHTITVYAAFLFVIVLSIGQFLARRFVQPINQLSMGVREIAGGNLDKKIEIATGDEIERLADSFNNMTQNIKAYMQEIAREAGEKERISTELSVAADIQSSMLPGVFPAFPDRHEFDIFATMHAAKEVGGDFYDFYLQDEKHLLVMIADVSGKGVAAALFMVIAKTMLNNFALYGKKQEDLADLVGLVNFRLCQNNEAMMFVTAFVGVLELDSGKFKYVNAGHNPPLIYRAAEKKFGYLAPKKNRPLGVKESQNYVGEEMDFAAGDMLYLYTDGVTEAMSETEELFGEQRLLDALNQTDPQSQTLPEILEKVSQTLAEHVQNAKQSDDITMLSLLYKG